MGYYLKIGLAESEPLATISGWGDVIRWLAGLPEGEYMELRGFVEYGWTQEMDAVEQEIAEALKHERPKDEDTVSILTNLAHLLAKRDKAALVATVTDATG